MVFGGLVNDNKFTNQLKLLKMKRILTGIKPTGIPHLGNILGSINPSIKLSKDNQTILFVADIHSLTQLNDPNLRKIYTRAVAASYIAFGFDCNKNILFKQSDRPEATELQFYLNCSTPLNVLTKSHALKYKEEVNVGTFTYPTLMAADILLYDTEIVPVGKDQLQHLEITRDCARRFNNQYGETLVVPEPFIQRSTETVIGIDGRKMSKSYNNTINIFGSDKELLKQVKLIVTDSTPMSDPKDPDKCNLFNIFKLVAEKDHIYFIREQYINGGLGYGNLKKELFTILLNKYSEPRRIFNELMLDGNTDLDKILESGKERAGEIAIPKIKQIKNILGL